MLDYGIRGTRNLLVDASGTCGAPLLIAVRDRIMVEGADDGTLRWQLPFDTKAGQVSVAGNTFTIRSGETTLSGQLLGGSTPLAADLTCSGSGDFLLVFTLQNSSAPELKIEGTAQKATIKAGARTIELADRFSIRE